MTIKDLASALRLKRANPKENVLPANALPDAAVVGLYTRCEQCGRPLFMDDRLIVDQSKSVDTFPERCALRVSEHRCDSGSKPQI